MTEVRVYFEGASALRPGFSALFQEIRRPGITLRPIACGPKSEAVGDFITAMKTHPESTNILLVDSDGPDHGTLPAEIKRDGNWDAGVGSQVSDDQLQFMVRIMETWFLGDRSALSRYYGSALAERSLPRNPQVEDIDKGTVLSCLKAATRRTGKRDYDKTRHAPYLLASLDVTRVRQAAPSCDRLFRFLESLQP